MDQDHSTTVIFFSGGFDSTELLIRAIEKDRKKFTSIQPISYPLINNDLVSKARICEYAAKREILKNLGKLHQFLKDEDTSKNVVLNPLAEFNYAIPFIDRATFLGQAATWVYLAALNANIVEKGVRRIELGTLISDEDAMYAREVAKKVFPAMASMTHRNGRKVKLVHPFLKNGSNKTTIVIEAGYRLEFYLK